MTVEVQDAAAENPRAISGDNRPPIAETLKEAVADLPDRLALEYSDIRKRSEELTAAFNRVPLVVTDDLAGAVSDQIAQISSHTKLAEAMRTAAIEPVLRAQRQINTWFDKNCFDALDTAKSTTSAKQVLGKRLTAYEVAKADEERRRREAAEREARRIAEEAERAARAEQDRADQERRAAEQAENERIAKIQNERDMAKAIELAEENKRLNEERDARAKVAAEEAEKRRIEADRATKEATAKAADMMTVRGDFGSSSSLRTVWKARRTSKDVPVDLNALRDFIGADIVEKAANAFARANKNTKPITGLEFYEEQSAVVRG